MLARIDKPRVKRDFITFDFEWIPGEDLLDDATNPKDPETGERAKQTSAPLRIRICGVVDGPMDGGRGTYRVYDSVKSFLAGELTAKNEGKWFYAHAGGSHDMEFVLEEILRQSQAGGFDAWKVRASFSGASAIIVHVSLGRQTWHFCDSYWLLRDGLASIGKAIGLPKLDEDKKQTKAEIREYFANIPKARLVPYNERDCVILWRAIDNFENTLLKCGGQLQMTIASCAMHLFRRKFLKKDIPTASSINYIARRAYFASRVEVFNRQAEDFLIYDINSSFPYAMTKPCPGRLLGSRRTIPPGEDAIYLADVLIEVPEMYLPPIPHRVGGRVFFPVGKWRSWMSNIDIELMLENGGRIVKVHEVLTFEPMMDLKDYAMEIYEMRKNANTAFEKLVFKYLLNALYGKFAEGEDKEGLVINPETINRKTMSMIMPGVWTTSQRSKISHVHVPISVHITAIARRTLYNFLKECERQKEPYHYVDTDSISTRATLPVSDELGGLKLEKKITSATFAAPKVYAGEGFELQKDGTWKPTTLAKAKGFSLPKNPREALDKLDKIIEGGEIEIQRMARLKELYRDQNSAPVEILIKKALRGLMLSKRFHYPDGSTRPWHVKELYSGKASPAFMKLDPFE